MDLRNVSFSDDQSLVVKILIEKPLEEWITSGESADCIDMDCDGGKKVLVRDLDGSLSEESNEPGVVFSQSEFAWGEPGRGVHDHRIPSSIGVPSESQRGITRSSPNCSLVDDSWKCTGVDSNYGVLIFESMDKDSTDRRLSPIVIRSSSGFVDMVNGPSNHRGSHGYAAISRISTFFFILRTGEEYKIAATSTLPKNFRLITTNFNSEGNILLHISTSNPQRMEIYRSGVFELPNNVRLNALGEIEFQLPNDSFIPKLESFKNGENYFDRKTQKFHVGIKTNSVLDVKTSSTILVSIGAVMEMTPVEFYAHKDLVYLLADFFELDSSQVKVVNVHKKTETSLAGRSSLLAKDEKEVEIEILPDEVDSLSSVISTSTFCKVRQGFKNTFNSTINSFKAQKNEEDKIDPTVSIFTVPTALLDIGSKNYTYQLRQVTNITLKIVDAENNFVETGDFSIRVTMKRLDSLDSRLEKSVALMMANAQRGTSIPGFEDGEHLSKLERKTLQRWNNRNQFQSENPTSAVIFKKKWKKNKVKGNKSKNKGNKKNKNKNSSTVLPSKIPIATGGNKKKPWANKWGSNKKTTAKPTTKPQSSTYSIDEGPKIVLDNIVNLVNGSFKIDIPTKYSGLYSLDIELIESENCRAQNEETIKMSINLEVLKSKNGAGQICKWENRVLICSGKELEALDGFFEIMKLSNMFVTESGNIPLELIQTVDLSNNKLSDVENLAEFVNFFENLDKLILDDNLFEDFELFLIEENAPNLSMVSLKNNKISSLSNLSLFENLKEVDLTAQNPPLQCVSPAALDGKAKVLV
ncbi:Oidioi.mRNA.OKI2018_I69.chr1.g1509.t1.cds [Oikopleura dioica]|uniref:Oidioi.mRNA.OKI2018_I69.chr1.g1509.t1.cds n=1 Tax=Oikopleura dioica TaxID=34765 RepID=A0ABN7SN54_OIKDI|nr:Oidioi.mRNA.OKI2018_I69.chr1.g1509.t1.cds [Oikopleura dioica]